MGCVWARIIGLELFFDGDFGVCFLLTADLLGRVVPNPVENTTDFRDLARRIKLRYMVGVVVGLVRRDSPWLRHGPVQEDARQAKKHHVCDDDMAVLEQDARNGREKSKSQRQGG